MPTKTAFSQLKFPNTAAGRRAEALRELTSPQPEALGHGTNDLDAIERARELFYNKLEIFRNEESIAQLRASVQDSIKAVIEAATEDEETIESFSPAGSIRHVTRSADIARELLFLMDLDPNLLTRMCIGDVRAPKFLEKALQGVFKEKAEFERLIHEKYGYGYEVGGKGLDLAKRMFFKYIDQHYGFSGIDGLMEKFTHQSAITNGGMGALSIIGSAMTHRAMEKGMHHRFVYPDNSFGTWKNIAKLISRGREENSKMVGTKKQNLLHLSPEDIEQFYADNPVPEEGIMETWCITPVGNPSGTKVDPVQLRETIKAVISHNPDATIILDSVYIRTLKPEVAQNLIGALLAEPEILEKIVFVESFSKSHGVCGEREGLFFTANKKLFDRIQRQNMTLFAGPGLAKSALLLALSTASDEENEAFDRLHEFWAAERKGLYDHLMQPKFTHLFQEEQPHIIKDQLENPLGLYVFLQLKPGITFKEVALDTHIIGVEEKDMFEGTEEEGRFIRFSVGTITQPTYSAPPHSPYQKIGKIAHVAAQKAGALLDKIGAWFK